MPVNYSPSKLAELFRVTTKTVNEWIAEGMPTRKAGGKGAGNAAKINLAEAVSWYHERRAPRVEAEAQRARKDRETADRIALENALRRGEVIEMVDAKRIIVDEVHRCKARLLQLPNAIAQHTPAETRALVVAAADRLVREALEELSSGDTGGVDGAAAPDGEPVG